MRRSYISLIALTGVLAFAAIQQAGVDPQEWNACLLGIGLIAGLYGAFGPQIQTVRLDRTVGICMLAILGLVVIQLVPLPGVLVHMLSPARFDLQAAAEPLTGGQAHFLTLTATPYQTAQYLLTLSGYAIVILLVRRLSQTWRDTPWKVVWPILVISGFEAVLGCYQAYLVAGAEAKGTYRNRDHYAALLEMALPFALTYPIAALSARSRLEAPVRAAVKACVGIAVFVLLLAGVILSLSRGAFLASLVAILVMVGMLFSVRPWNRVRAGTVRPWLRWVGLAFASALVIGVFLYLPTDALVDRLATLPRTEGVSGEIRVQNWRDTRGLIRDYPLFGCGVGSYGSCFLRYKKVTPMLTTDYAHNDYLQVLAEFGVFGFAAGLILVARLVLSAVRGARRNSSADEQCVAIACVGAMVAILLHSFVDFNMYVPANGFECAWILGIAAAFSGDAGISRNTRRRSGKARNASQEMLVSSI